MAETVKCLRSYEISVWTLQDECITVLKPSELEFKGEVLNGSFMISDDGTEELTFSIPMYYNEGGKLILNPAWLHILNGHFTANMHKVKLIFNRATEDELVYELLIVNVAQTHESDLVVFEIRCEGLAFHELGKLGYKISLSSDTFEREFGEWFENGSLGEAPHATIQYWNDKIFKYDDGTLKYAWDYEVNMDWSGFSSAADRDPHRVYEEEYVSSWNVDPFEYNFSSASVEGYREKWRQMDEEESNIYNLTQAIAERFGVYCRYEYTHDENYHIVDRKVIYYNSSFKELEGYTDLTYPYNAAKVVRTIDNTDTITKLFVRPIESDSSSSNLISITTVEGNPSKEDYLLNFDYLRDVHTITDELYELVHIYEGKLREINEQAVRLETQIMLVQEELTKVRADYTTYTNAITLDIERLNNASLLYQLLTGNDEVIHVTAANPDILVLRKISKDDLAYYVDMPYEGILPETVNLYRKLNYTRLADDGRLENLITTGKLQFDEFNNLSRINNIYTPDDELTRVYMTCDYSPRLYYDKVVLIWKQRLASDTANLAKADIDIRSLELLLYSADTDYCHADYATADGASVQTSVALEKLRLELKNATDYDEFKIDFNNRAMYMGENSKGVSIKHRDWEENDIVYECTPTAVEFVYAGIEGRYIIVTPVLPSGKLLNDGNASGQTSRRILYALNLALDYAQAYAEGEITLDTPLTLPGATIFTFRDIYIATAVNVSEAANICSAFYEYDIENITTPCAFEGNAIADYTYSDSGYTDKALTDEAHGYCALYDFLLEKKYKIVTNFERWMGPALREGYWQADDYNDYGNKYANKFKILSSTELVVDDGKPELIDFTWDTSNVFTGENETYYEVDTNLNKEYYLLVDLRPYLNKLYNYTDTLCFIYYDSAFLEENDKIKLKLEELKSLLLQSGLTSEELARLIYLDDKADLTTEEVAELADLSTRNQLANDTEHMIKYKLYYKQSLLWDEAIERNTNMAQHWFTIGSECLFGYAWCNDQISRPQVRGYIPVLILTGMKELTLSELLSIFSPYVSITGERYEPFLGTVATHIETYRDITGRQFSEIKTDILHISDINTPLSYINTTGTISLNLFKTIAKNITNELGESQVAEIDIPYTIHFINYGNAGTLDEPIPDACLAYPRIRINSLELKNNSADILLSLKGINSANDNVNTAGYRLEYIKDFYVLMKADKADNSYKYFITIKPEIFIKYAQNRFPQIDINYATSNANEAIYLDAVKVMKENAYPKVSYNVSLNTLNPYILRIAYKKLRSIIHINDYELLLDKTTGYISKIILDLDNPWNDSVEVKNYETKFEDLFSTIVALSENMRKNENTISIAAAAFSPGGTLYSSILQESMLKADLNYSFNLGKLTIDEHNGIWGVSESGVIAIRGGGIFTATEKDEGGNWHWNTGILPTGINADLITTGLLDTNRIRIYAGDKVAFLMNGEGIFAYKTYASDLDIKGMTEALAAAYKKAEADIDALLFVTYNENGLFFRTKSGTKVLLRDKTDFLTLTQDVDRVEISWNGLILRDWQGKKTLYTDPDYGDLTLSGAIISERGSIGSWTIDDIGLHGSYISLVNGKMASENGIFLENSTAVGLKTITYNNKTYYAYTIVGDNSNKIYYLESAASDGLYTLQASDDILTYQPRHISARPRWTTTVSEEKQIPIGIKPGENGELEVVYSTLTYKYTYITSSDDGPFIYYGEDKIEYDGSNSLNSLWLSYLRLLNMDNSTYVDYTDVSELTNVKGNISVGTVLELNSYRPTFSVYASTGEVKMNKGDIGPFKLTNETLSGLNNGIINQTTITNCVVNNNKTSQDHTIDYDDLLLDVTGSGDTGWITFTRVNGKEINFNVADMNFYKDNISAAQEIKKFDWDIVENGRSSYVTVYAETVKSEPHKTSYYRKESESIGHIWLAGWNAVGIKSINISISGTLITATAKATNDASDSTTASGTSIAQLGANSVEVGTLRASSGMSTTMTRGEASGVNFIVPLTSKYASTRDIEKGLNLVRVWDSGYNAAKDEIGTYTVLNETLYRQSGYNSYIPYTGTLYKKS